MNQNNPALVGEQKQYIQYMIDFDGSEDANVIFHDLSVNISGYTQLSGNLNGLDTLKLSDSPYWVTSGISFTGGTHVVEAGVEIHFSANTGLEIGQANMKFEGTSSNPVLLTSYTSEQGVWNGVYYNASSDAGVSSQMDYVIIENAGNGTWNANLFCENTNEPLISNCSLRNAVGNGLRLNYANLSINVLDVAENTENGIYIQNSGPSIAQSNILNNDNAGIFFADLASNPNFFNCNISGNYFGIQYPSPNYSFPVITGILNYSNIISGIAVSGGNITSNQTWPYNPL
jgi:hypothetical protein